MVILVAGVCSWVSAAQWACLDAGVYRAAMAAHHSPPHKVTSGSSGSGRALLGAAQKPWFACGAVVKDVKKFCRICQCFVGKFVHALVQSRTGAKVATFGYSISKYADSIGIQTDEIGEVSAYLKMNFPSYPVLPEQLNVDFLLHTVDGYDLPLESWRVSVLYNSAPDDNEFETLPCMDLGMLLKSALSAARVTPAFRYYVRSQSDSTYVVTYRVYEGAANIDLGEGQKSFALGKAIAKHGSVSVHLHYRTKMAYEQSMLSPKGIDLSSCLRPETRLENSLKLKSHSISSEYSSHEKASSDSFFTIIEAQQTARSTASVSCVKPCDKYTIKELVSTCPFVVLCKRRGLSNSQSVDNANCDSIAPSEQSSSKAAASDVLPLHNHSLTQWKPSRSLFILFTTSQIT
ncbi:unnamed protein product [Gongylonema pulchrum]|uniref:HORMA domain-containing protein n=1 Tax=Gongylonema pulchrum TaxID=637853 RepID=A0A183DNE1_9BILA|nr:unnamed protein product [Gongylonema pulchrum]